MTWCVERVEHWRHLGAVADLAPFYSDVTISQEDKVISQENLKDSFDANEHNLVMDNAKEIAKLTDLYADNPAKLETILKI